MLCSCNHSMYVSVSTSSYSWHEGDLSSTTGIRPCPPPCLRWSFFYVVYLNPADLWPPWSSPASVSYFAPQSTGVTDSRYQTWLCMGSGDLNSDCHAQMVRALLTDLSLHPYAGSLCFCYHYFSTLS